MKPKPTISIIDYGLGNLYSITKACRKFSDSVVVTEDPEVIRSSSALILPGVGSFGAGIDGLKRRGLVKIIKEFADSGRPILGICLGAQLMMSWGYEFGEFAGLSIVSGKVIKFGKLLPGTKVPHIGWNKITVKSKKKEPIFSSLGEKSYFYFVHSYVMQPEDSKNIFATTNYGGNSFCSIIKQGNIYGCQFHPEKSGEVGLKVIKNFIRLI
ncbi:MAG: imidazole glycerol phosphate synthase subunit HisH [Candidatus Yanofskybacteria bacterium]|nr:imidazole glycerol phosphate synthase subunit HisH [Candidatus Yanofskybacteria bacterium]